MKTLYILRHAKAERDTATGQDFDRPLAERGWDDAERVGRAMRARALEPDAVLASPATRAAETVEALARGYGPLRPNYDERIYDAPVDRLLEIVRGADDSAERLLIVGHNPGFEALVLRLADEETSDRIVDGFPTAALAVVELPVSHWTGVRERTGRLIDVIVPGALKV